ncbi:hypothetical protein NDU88_002937 [Pleurodeles waltl]|uniref:Uncharacterized protein n=1 Tax=Pleurodeles waltl TaxID=8319 RepID=A0AAV7TLZ6_PLEWA|nr:hypothetical protein NDU88_002937 [Pleurodeles waltl]
MHHTAARRKTRKLRHQAHQREDGIEDQDADEGGNTPELQTPVMVVRVEVLVIWEVAVLPRDAGCDHNSSVGRFQEAQSTVCKSSSQERQEDASGPQRMA